jgi:hypothetical protein
MGQTKRLNLSALSALAIAGTISSSAFAKDIFVPGDFPTIQQAIDAAEAGDQVIVSAGAYAEQVSFLGKSITVRGTAGAIDTVIDGGGNLGYVVKLTGASARLEGFTITGGRGTWATPGGGVKITGSGASLVGCTVTKNEGIQGAGINLTSASATLGDLEVSDNLAYQGGGLYAVSSSFQLSDSVFKLNRVDFQGGGICARNSKLSIVGVEFNENGWGEDLGQAFVYYTDVGGGLYTENVTGAVRDCVFSNNIGYRGGAVYVVGTGTLRMVNSLIVGNQGALGGGVCVNNASPILTNCTVVNNNLGGLYTAFAVAQPVVTNCVFSANSNSANIYGAGTTFLSYSLVNGAIPAGVAIGDGVIQKNPKLGGDFQPLPGSPVIDAGNNRAIGNVATDLAGNPRKVDDPNTPDTGLGTPPIVDMGAFEFQAGRRP